MKWYKCKTYDEFKSRFWETMAVYQIDDVIVERVGDLLFESMSSSQLKYHTPAHILTIFDFAKNAKVELTFEEELAIWFHDAIYFLNQKPGDNESASARFFGSFSHLFELCDESDREIKDYICGTADFLLPTDQLTYHSLKIMDLDLCSFAMDYAGFTFLRERVQEELGTTNQQTAGFYKMLLARGPIFRVLTQFEDQAQSNIKRFLESC